MQVTSPAALAREHKWQGQIYQRRHSHRASLAPIKAWVRQQNRDPADDEPQETERVRPMRDAHQH